MKGGFFLQSGLHFGGNVFKFQFRPMIGSLRSRCTFYRPKGKELEAASDMYHPGSMKERVEVPKSYPCLGDT
jgi:hypothetical protein